MFLFNTETGVVDSSIIEPRLLEVLTSSGIPYMEIHDEKILVGTSFNGLYILDLDFNVLEIISENEGLIDETIAHVYSDQRIMTMIC